jgi:hypothetical protein
MKKYLHLVITILFLSLPHILIFKEWFFTSEMPNVFEGLPEFTNLFFIKQFFVKFGYIPLWCSMRNSGMPLTFFLLPGWWVWSFPLISLTLVFDEVIAGKIIFSFFATLSSVSMYTYGFRLTKHKVSSVLAGWIYSSSGVFLTVGLTHFHINFAIFWALIPLVFLSLDEIFMGKWSLVSISKAALIAWVAFSSQPLFFSMSFIPFMLIRMLFLIYTKTKSDYRGAAKRAFVKISIFAFISLFLNLWWIVPQFSYQTLYLTPVYVNPKAIFIVDAPLSTHTFSEIISMQTFSGGGTEFLKDPGIAGLRSFGFFLPFSLSLIAPIVCRKDKREVYYLFVCFFTTFLFFLFFTLARLSFPSKVVSQAFFTSCLSGFALRGIFGRLSDIYNKNDIFNCSILKGFKRKALPFLLLITVSTFILSSGFVEMHRLTETYVPPEEVDEAYAFLSTLSKNENVMILNVPFITPIGKPYYSQVKPDNFIGYYYSYLTDYETVTHGLRNCYGPINEYEPNKYVSSTLLVLHQTLQSGYFNDFLALLNFFPSLEYMVVYRDLVSPDIISFFENDARLKIVYENSFVLVFQNLRSGEASRTRITDAPVIVSTSTVGSSMITLGCLFDDLKTNVLPLVLFNESSPQMGGFSFHVLNEEGRSWVFEAEDLLSRSEGAFISEPFNHTNLSPSNGKGVTIENGGFANFSFNLAEKDEYTLSFRIFRSSERGGVLSFDLDGQWLGSHETSSSKSCWGWINFTATLEPGRHEVRISNLGNATCVEHVDIMVVSSAHNWDELLACSLLRTFVATSRTKGYNVFADIPPSINAPFLLVIDEAYFPSWRLSVKNREYSPTVANAFLTGFIVDKPSSGEASIKFTLSLGEKLAFSSSFIILLTMGVLFVLDILRKIKERKVKLKNKTSVSACENKGGFKS